MILLKKKNNTDTVLTLYSENGRSIHARIDDREPDTFTTYEQYLKYFGYIDPSMIILLEENDFIQRAPTEKGSAWAKIIDEYGNLLDDEEGVNL